MNKFFASISSYTGDYTPPVYDGKIILIRWWWQSNALGSAPQTSYPSKYIDVDLPYYNIWNNTTKAFQKFNSSKLNYPPYSSNSLMGADPILAELLSINHPDIPVYMSKYAIGNTGVFDDNINVDWNISNNELYQGSLDYYNSAKKKLQLEFPTKQIIDVDIGIGGEKDTADDYRYNVFQSNLEALTNNRVDAIGDDLICIFQRLSADSVWNTIGKSVVNQSIDNITAQRIRTHSVNTDSFEMLPDLAHYSYSGYIGLANSLYLIISSYL